MKRLWIIIGAVISLLMLGITPLYAQSGMYIQADENVAITLYADGGVSIQNKRNVSIGVDGMEIPGFTTESNYRFDPAEVQATCPGGGRTSFIFTVQPDWGSTDSYEVRIPWRRLCGTLFASDGTGSAQSGQGESAGQSDGSLGSPTRDTAVCQVTPRGNRVNVRNGPGTDFGIAGRLSPGYYLTVESVTDTGWYKVTGAEQYVSATVVTAHGPNCPAAQTPRDNPTAAADSTSVPGSRPEPDNFCLMSLVNDGYVTVYDPYGVTQPTTFYEGDEPIIILTNRALDYRVTVTDDTGDDNYTLDGATCTIS